MAYGYNILIKLEGTSGKELGCYTSIISAKGKKKSQKDTSVN